MTILTGIRKVWLHGQIGQFRIAYPSLFEIFYVVETIKIEVAKNAARFSSSSSLERKCQYTQWKKMNGKLFSKPSSDCRNAPSLMQAFDFETVRPLKYHPFRRGRLNANTTPKNLQIYLLHRSAHLSPQNSSMALSYTNRITSRNWILQFQIPRLVLDLFCNLNWWFIYCRFYRPRLCRTTIRRKDANLSLSRLGFDNYVVVDCDDDEADNWDQSP